jgi:RNA polymerase sigma factor (sigma-70 family)
MTTACPPQRGDEAELYSQLAHKLARIVANRVKTSSANVDDACAFAWLQMLRHQPPRETLLAWLVTTGTREATKLDRRARRQVEPTDDLADVTCLSTGHRPIEAHLDVLAAREAIADAGLRPREAEILSAHVAGYSYAEIADAKCLTTRTVERQLLRANRRLRAARELQRRDAEEGVCCRSS